MLNITIESREDLKKFKETLRNVQTEFFGNPLKKAKEEAFLAKIFGEKNYHTLLSKIAKNEISHEQSVGRAKRLNHDQDFYTIWLEGGKKPNDKRLSVTLDKEDLEEMLSQSLTIQGDVSALVFTTNKFEFLKRIRTRNDHIHNLIISVITGGYVVEGYCMAEGDLLQSGFIEFDPFIKEAYSFESLASELAYTENEDVYLTKLYYAKPRQKDFVTMEFTKEILQDILNEKDRIVKKSPDKITVFGSKELAIVKKLNSINDKLINIQVGFSSRGITIYALCSQTRFILVSKEIQYREIEKVNSAKGCSQSRVTRTGLEKEGHYLAKVKGLRRGEENGKIYHLSFNLDTEEVRSIRNHFESQNKNTYLVVGIEAILTDETSDLNLDIKKILNKDIQEFESNRLDDYEDCGHLVTGVYLTMYEDHFEIEGSLPATMEEFTSDKIYYRDLTF